MKAVFKFWLVLFPTLAIGRFLVSLQGHNHIDLRFEAFAQIVIIPLIQSVFLAIVFNQFPWKRIRQAVQIIFQHPLVAILICCDLALLVLGWFPIKSISLSSPDTMIRLYIGLKSLGIGIWIVFIALRKFESFKDRCFLFILGIGLAAYGSDNLLSWILLVPDLLLPSWPQLYRWIFIFVPVYVFFLLVFFKIISRMEKDFPESSVILNAAVFVAAIGTCIVVLNTFNRPFLLPPWNALVMTCSYLTLTMILTGFVVYQLETRIRPQRSRGTEFSKSI